MATVATATPEPLTESGLLDKISFLSSVRAQRMEDKEGAAAIGRVDEDIRATVNQLISLRTVTTTVAASAATIPLPDPHPPQQHAVAAASPPLTVGEVTKGFVDARDYTVWYVVGARSDGAMAKQITRLTQMEETKRISPTTVAFLEDRLSKRSTTGGVSSVTTVLVPNSTAWEFEAYAKVMATKYSDDNPDQPALAVSDIQEAIKYALLENPESLREIIMDHILLGDYSPSRIYDATTIVLTEEERAALPRGVNVSDRPAHKAPTLSGQNMQLKMVQNPRKAGDYFVKAYFPGQIKMAVNLMTNAQSSVVLQNGNVYYVNRVLVRDFGKLYQNVLAQLGVRRGADRQLKAISDVDLFIDEPLDVASTSMDRFRLIVALEDVRDRLIEAGVSTEQTLTALENEITTQELAAGVNVLQSETGMPEATREAMLDHIASQLATEKTMAILGGVRTTKLVEDNMAAVVSLSDKFKTHTEKQTTFDSRLAKLETELLAARRELLQQAQASQALLSQLRLVTDERDGLKGKAAAVAAAAPIVDAVVASPIMSQTTTTTSNGRPKDSYLYYDPSNPSTMLVVRPKTAVAAK